MKKAKLSSISLLLPLLVLAVLELLYQIATPLVMDDLWYKTNLVTGEPLKSLSDIIQSQVWHYFNWGGRSMTHAFLQLNLMFGPLFCDIMNMIMTFLLCVVIASFAQNKANRFFYFSGAFSLLICLNASIRYNMFWESGAVNYLHSSVWILFFMKVFLRELENEEINPLKGVSGWIIPLGLITGWSTENMGPSAFLLSLMVIFLVRKNKKYSRIPWWMTLGCISSLLGSALVILAPGNFVRSAFAENSGLLGTLVSRFLSMLTGACSFLLPPFVIAVLLFITCVFVLNIRLQNRDIILIITSILAFGAMVLSPHFPPRAVFGIMVLLIVLILSFIEEITKLYPAFKIVGRLFILCTYVYSIIQLYICVCYYY